MEYIWGYLKANSLIKPIRVNIGLISSSDVKEQRNKIKEEISSLFKSKCFKNSVVKEDELNGAVNCAFGLIDETIGDLKKLPDDKTIASYLDIKKTYFLNNKKQVPEALNEFIELALAVVFRLEEKKEPPK